MWLGRLYFRLVFLRNFFRDFNMICRGFLLTLQWENYIKKFPPSLFILWDGGCKQLKIRIMYRMCDSGGTQTRDTQFRKLMLYSPELRNPFEYPFMIGFQSFLFGRILSYFAKSL